MKQSTEDTFNASDSRQSLSRQITKGRKRINADTDLRLTKYFGASQGYFLRYQEYYELRIAKVILQRILAGFSQLKLLNEIKF